MLSARHSRIYQLRARTPQDAGTQTFSSSRIAAYARKCAAARRADGRRRLPDGYLPQACRARRRGDRPRAQQARNRAGHPGSTVWSVGDSLSTPMPTSRAAGRPAVQSRTFRASRATRRFSRYRQSRPSISYLNIRANFV
ncbi:conserved hypothetical protein [Burkholderia pseudomallei 668]|nr:conserved hypothetical protein [Burkholderia pseudomallei 668]